jgi:hypothetical protein
MERLLHDTLSSAGRDVLYLSRVSLKETSACLCAPGSLQLSSILPVFDSTAFVLGEHEHACVAGGANPGEGASAHEDIEGLVQKVALLEGELAEARQAREAVKEKFHSLSDLSVDGMRLLVVSEKKQWGSSRRGCESLPSTMLKWSESLPRFGWQCLLPRSWCWGARLMKSSG